MTERRPAGAEPAPPLEALPFVDYQYPARPPADGRPLLALVGEAPGAEEARLGRPFVGRSGRLLDEALEAVGIDRAECLVANTFRHQPPGNKVGHFFASRRRAGQDGRALDLALGPFGSSDYCLADHAGDVRHLAATLEKLRPRAIVALGRTPLWALTGLGGILTVRGRPAPCRLYGDAQVVPTLHPSYVLRGNWDQLDLLRDDLALAARLAAGNA